MTEPLRPTYCITIGSEDVTELVDVEGLSRLMTERGDASCTFTLPCADENDWPTNQLAVDALVAVLVDGTRRWYGHVVNWSRDEADIDVECAGEWDLLHHRENLAWAFLETRTDQFVEYVITDRSGGMLEFTDVTKDTNEQVLISIPSGTPWLQDQRAVMSLWVLGGHHDSSESYIRRVTFDWAAGGATADIEYGVEVIDGPGIGGTSLVSGNCGSGASGSVDTGDLGTGTTTDDTLSIYLLATGVSGTTSAETYIQIRNLKVYVASAAAQTVDVYAAYIWTDVTGLSDTETETIGSALSQMVVDPFVTGADAIQQVLAKATTPPLCGCIHGTFKCLARDSAPTDNARLWVVSEQLTPGLSWQVEPDRAQSKDYVVLTYTDPSEQTIYQSKTKQYPTGTVTKTSRVALIDAGTELTTAEATVAAQQAYAYYHELWQGQVTIPYLCHNGLGQESPADHIECWDWVYNAGKAGTDEAGPFLISEVSHQNGVATLTIGATEGYGFEAPYRLPTKGRYVGAHRTRKRESWVKWWRRTHKGKRVPKKHPKWHYGKWKDVEATYV